MTESRENKFSGEITVPLIYRCDRTGGVGHEATGDWDRFWWPLVLFLLLRLGRCSSTDVERGV